MVLESDRGDWAQIQNPIIQVVVAVAAVEVAVEVGVEVIVVLIATHQPPLLHLRKNNQKNDYL